MQSETWSMSPSRAAAKQAGVDEDGTVSLLVFYRWCQRLWGQLELVHFGDAMTVLARSAKVVQHQLCCRLSAFDCFRKLLLVHDCTSFYILKEYPSTHKSRKQTIIKLLTG